MKYHIIVLSLFLVCSVFVSGCSNSSKTISEITNTSESDIDENLQVDHSLFTEILKKHVNDEGYVDYEALQKKDISNLDAYIQTLRNVNPQKLSYSEKLAFFINAYNAVTLRAIIEFYPINSIKDKVSHVPGIGYNIWDDYTVEIDGKNYSLNNIEHDILRKMNEPRIHFAINCASIGCPKLIQEAYSANILEEQLSQVSKDFFNGRERDFFLDTEKNTAYFSQIFNWFGEDFGSSDEEKLNFALRYINDTNEISFINNSNNIQIEYTPYDWSLNDISKNR